MAKNHPILIRAGRLKAHILKTMEALPTQISGFLITHCWSKAYVMTVNAWKSLLSNMFRFCYWKCLEQFWNSFMTIFCYMRKWDKILLYCVVPFFSHHNEKAFFFHFKLVSVISITYFLKNVLGKFFKILSYQ